MANPQTENGYLRIATELFKQFLIRDFSAPQRRIIDFILLGSYGCHKTSAIIKPQNLLEVAGVYESNFKREMKYLQLCKVVQCDFKNGIYSINKNYETWAVGFQKTFDEEKLKKYIHLNLKNDMAEMLDDIEGQEELITPISKNLSAGEVLGISEGCTYQPDKVELITPISKNLSAGEVFRSYNAEADNVSGMPKDSIKDSIKDNVSICYINVAEEEKKEKENSVNSEEIFDAERYKISDKKKMITDPLYSKEMVEFLNTFKKECKKPTALSPSERIKLMNVLNDLIINQGFEPQELAKTLCDNFNTIKFDLPSFSPSINWLLKNDCENFYATLNGQNSKQKSEIDEYMQQQIEEERKINAEYEERQRKYREEQERRCNEYGF